MITIDVKRKENYISEIKIKGHANYADYGFDIVCASVSSISTTTVNAIIRYDSLAITYSEDDGLLEIKILKYDNIVNILIENMISMLKDLEKQYKNNIKIR